MSERTIKVAELVKETLGRLIIREIEFPLGVIVTITKVNVSPDLRLAKIYLSIMPVAQEREAMKILINEAKNLRHLLGQEIVLRATPQLRFFIDEGERKATEINELLDNLKY